MTPRVYGFISAMVFLAFHSTVRAADIAWLIPGPIANSNGGSTAAMDGLEFTPAEIIQVTALGWYDDTFSTADGLAVSHTVGIWNLSTQALVTSMTVPSGMVAPRIGNFRFVDLPAAVPLAAGTQYVIGGLGGTVADPNYILPTANLILGPGISVGQWRTGNIFFSFPNSPVGSPNVQLGATFKFIPEPNTALLVLVCGVTWAARRPHSRR